MSATKPRQSATDPPIRIERTSRGRTRLALAILAVVIVAYALYHVATVLLVILTGVLLAVLLDGLTSSLTDHTPLARTGSLAVVIGVSVLASGAFFALAGGQLADQLSGLSSEIPAGLERLDEEIQSHSWGRAFVDGGLAEKAMESRTGLLERITGVFGKAFGTAANIFAILVIGVFLAAKPMAYTRAALALVPPARRDRAGEVLEQLGTVLRWWLVARVLSMLIVGVLTLIGLLIVGLDMALALAVIAALLAFIPFIGPLLSAVPAILIGLLSGPTTALWVAGVYVAVQLLESNFITPLIEQRTLSVPPAALISSQLLLGVLFGFMGVLLGTPLLVIAITLVRMLYIEDVLGERAGDLEPG